MKAFFLVFIFLSISGCASSRLKLDQDEFASFPEQIDLQVPFVEQTSQLCGPTSLYMVTKPLSPGLDLKHVVELSFTPGASGTFPQDMLSATRRLGFAPYAMKDFHEIFESLVAGTPVVIFHHTGFLWKDLWHYSVLTGYDRSKSELILHIGPYAYRHADFSKVFQSWNEGGKWAFVVRPADAIPESATFQEALDNALAFLRLGLTDEATQLSEKMLKRWPEHYEEDVVLAEARFRKNQKHLALESLKRANQKHPGNHLLREKILEFSRAE